ncbi:MAG: GGDEF domain-containing protein [Alcaligenaceae bacterium]|nr:GGDEF domain-containing protein [Alcaligenaceae bacterium]
MLNSILQDNRLSPLFQPVVDLNGGGIIGYEGLIRGPLDSSLHSPIALFNRARRDGQVVELETLCHYTHVENFIQLELEGKLFLNMSPDVMVGRHSESTVPVPGQDAGMEGRIVIELTEGMGSTSYDCLRDAIARYRKHGLQLALDDIGEGFSSLRRWSELRPEYVKIDKYFVQDIDRDPVKRQFVQAMVEIALQANAAVIAEGIETEAELEAVRSLGVRCGQGYLLGHPSARPLREVEERVRGMLGERRKAGKSRPGRPAMATARKVLREVPTVLNTLPTNEVYAIFQNQPELQVLAVLCDGVPVGLIHRSRMLDRLARPYQRELYGTKPCAHFIENEPLIVDHNTSLQDLAHLFTEKNPHHLFEGFIITADQTFIGVGTGFDLLREITQMQMDAARYANPLTQLPGNVPINEHLDMLLEHGEAFAVCYADLDHFKPFNDLYGYRNGDEAIQLTAQLLSEHIDAELDFLGHIGGDDFIIIFRSDDWKRRSQAIVDGFAQACQFLYQPDHLEAGGYMALNRQGQEVFHQLLSISLGIVCMDGRQRLPSAQVAEMATAAKAEAKKLGGNALFVERRAVPEGVH